MDFSLKLKCDACNCDFDVDLEDYDLSWEVVDSDERNMGVELHHQAVVEMECSKCDAPITLTLDVWEYPIGVSNLEEIDVEGATLVEGCSLDGLAPLGD